jgi:hypothetical protein
MQVTFVRTLTISGSNFDQIMTYSIDGSVMSDGTIEGTFSGFFSHHSENPCSMREQVGPAGTGTVHMAISPGS